MSLRALSSRILSPAPSPSLPSPVSEEMVECICQVKGLVSEYTLLPMSTDGRNLERGLACKRRFSANSLQVEGVKDAGEGRERVRGRAEEMRSHEHFLRLTFL